MLAMVDIYFHFTFFIITFFYHVITVYFHFFFTVYNLFAMYILFAFKNIGK